MSVTPRAGWGGARVLSVSPRVFCDADAQGGPVGRDLDGGTSEALSEEQTAKLDELAAAARAASPRLGDAAADADDDGPAAPRGGKTE